MKKLLVMLLMVAPMAAFAQAKFGHFNASEVMRAMPEVTTMNTEMEALRAQYEADLKSMQDELQKKAEAYEKEQATLPANIKQRREQELQDMYQKIQQSAQDNQQALQQAYAEKMQPIQQKVMDAIKAVGDAGGFVYIIDMASAQGIPYVSTTLSVDVTAQVKAKLGLK